MSPKLFEAALDEAIRFGSAARLVLTFPGNEDALHIHPLAYTQVDGDSYRIEIRVSDYVADDMVDDVIFADAASIEMVELQVKAQGAVWKDEPYGGYEGADGTDR
ncbi:MAG: hypothetical protein ACE5EQ_04810 [Phycisphaerae bacterium]